MTIVKGYFDTKSETFLGNMISKDSRTNAAITPRYVEGVCYGEFNTQTEEFTPLTNPMVIPKGQIMTIDVDHDSFLKGNYKEIVSGIQEDAGADMVAKGFKLNKPNARPKIAREKKTLTDAINFNKLF